MGFYYEPVNEDDMNIQSKTSILLADTAVDEASAEQFETDAGKLVIQETGDAWGKYINVPTAIAQTLGDYPVVIVPASQTVDPGTGHFKFKVWRGAVGVETPGAYYFNLIIKRADS